MEPVKAWRARAHVIHLQTCTPSAQIPSTKWVTSTHTHACTQWEAAFWRRLATIRGFSSLRRGPLARPGLERGHILQGVSKQRWHVDVLARAPFSAPYHRISRPCQKGSRSCFLSPPFFFSFSSLSPEKQLSARENRIIVCFNGCSIPQVYPDLKIPIK